MPARYFGDLLAKGESTSVRLETTGLDLALELGQLSASLRLVDGDPPRPLGMEASAVPSSISAPEIQRCAAITVAASTDAQRPVLTGVHFARGFAEATDSYRIARTELSDWHSEVVVSTDLIRLVAATATGLNARFDGRRVQFESDNATWTCTTIDAPFPSLDGHLMHASSEILRGDRLALLDAVDAAGVIPHAAVDLVGRGELLAVTAEAPDVGRIESVLRAVTPRDGLLATFSASYLRDALRLATGDHVSLQLLPRFAIMQCEAFKQLVSVHAQTG